MVPLCWQFWHTYRIEDLVSNILMADQDQIFILVNYVKCTNSCRAFASGRYLAAALQRP